MFTTELIFGAQYYRPPFPTPPEWERDLKNMQENGFNTIKLWAVWNWVEREPGVYYFEDLDAIIELAEQYGLKTVINTIPEGAPYWIYSKYPDSLYKTSKGQEITVGGPANLPSAGWPGFCWDSAPAREAMEAFIEATARHYADRDSVIAIDVWNEPHLEPMFDYKDELLCYCNHSIEAFREWLKEKYTTLDALSEAWFRRYDSWDAVVPPPRFGTWADMVDWRVFWIENLQRWLRFRVAAARRGAPNKIMQTHVAYSGVIGNKFEGGLCNELGDEFALAKEVEVFGLTGFPRWLYEPELHMFTHLIHNEIVAEASGDKPFYQVELQGGAGKAGLLGGVVPNHGDVVIWNFNTVAAGGKGVLYWQYSPEPAGIESPGFGLVGFQGEATERSKAAGYCAKKLNTPTIASAKRVKAVNAIYVSRNSQALTFSADRKEHLYAGSVSGAYHAAYEAGIPVRFFHEDTIEELLSENIQVLYLPMTLVLSSVEIDTFTKFVQRGGTIIGEAAVGLYGTDTKLDLASRALDQIFGVEHREVQATTPTWGTVTIDKSKYFDAFQGKQYRHVVALKEGTEVLARFSDGEAAVIEYTNGKGKAIFVATCLSYGYLKTFDAGSASVITNYLVSTGYQECHALKVDGGTLIVRLLENDTHYVLVAVNHSSEAGTFSFEFVPGLVTDSVVRGEVGGHEGEVYTIAKQ